MVVQESAAFAAGPHARGTEQLVLTGRGLPDGFQGTVVIFVYFFFKLKNNFMGKGLFFFLVAQVFFYLFIFIF